MKRTRPMSVLTAVAALLIAGTCGWWLGSRHASGPVPVSVDGTAAPTGGAGPVGIDPSQWTISQGEEATRRHIRDSLKAGDVDPVTGRRILNYHDPMVPGKNFDAPAKSPFMDMMLVPRYVGTDAADASSVAVSPRIQQNLGLRTASVVEGALVAEVTAVGNVAWNERERVELGARAMGFVERLHVKSTFDRVAAGAPLADLYVPDWVAAQEEYLAVARLDGEGMDSLKDAARQRMQQAGMTPAHIQRVVSSGIAQPYLTLTAPFAGVVSELNIREGATVTPGMVLLRLQGTRTVWAEGAVTESQAALLEPGLIVRITSPGVPGQTFEGRVQALLPEVDAVTRTVRVRVELANPQGRLFPGMQVSMRLERPAGPSSLLVPSDAIIHTGRRSVVMLAEEGGRFRPLEVMPGMEANGLTEVKAGLRAGQRVVLSGQFLIDSEASLRGLQTRLDQEPQPGTSQARYTTDAVIDALVDDTVTLTHPPIPALKWPEMQMDFRLPPKDRQPRRMAVGDRLQIEFEMQDGDVPQITGLKVMPPEKAR